MYAYCSDRMWVGENSSVNNTHNDRIGKHRSYNRKEIIDIPRPGCGRSCAWNNPSAVKETEALQCRNAEQNGRTQSGFKSESYTYPTVYTHRYVRRTGVMRRSRRPS